MLWYKTIKNPVLTTGILILIIFIYDLGRRGILDRYNLIPNSCYPVKSNLTKRLPKSWTIYCDRKHNLNFDINEKSLDKRSLIYRQIANYFYSIGQKSPKEHLEKINEVNIIIRSEKINIEAKTSGKSLAEYSVLKDPIVMKEHLKRTVKVKEFVK